MKIILAAVAIALAGCAAPTAAHTTADGAPLPTTAAPKPHKPAPVRTVPRAATQSLRAADLAAAIGCTNYQSRPKAVTDAPGVHDYGWCQFQGQRAVVYTFLDARDALSLKALVKAYGLDPSIVVQRDKWAIAPGTYSQIAAASAALNQR